jgi:hypothetical protein
MASQMGQMVLMKQRMELIQTALAFAKGNKQDADYLEAVKEADKQFKKDMRKLAKAERAGKELTKARQEIEDMELHKQKYEKVFVFKGHDDNYIAAREALWGICDAEDWATAKSGRRGSNKTQSYHGGMSGKFKITCDEEAAYLWAADTNSMNQVLTLAQLPGAEELGDDEGEEEDEEEDDDTLLDELDQCIVAGGKTSEEIKQMTPLEKNQHATLCDKNRNIKAKDVSNIAKKMGCPEEKTTKHAKLQWIFVAYLRANA